MACLPCAMARMATNGELAGSEAARVWWSKYGTALLIGMAVVASVGAVAVALKRKSGDDGRDDRRERSERRRKYGLYGMKRPRRV